MTTPYLSLADAAFHLDRAQRCLRYVDAYLAEIDGPTSAREDIRVLIDAIIDTNIRLDTTHCRLFNNLHRIAQS